MTAEAFEDSAASLAAKKKPSRSLVFGIVVMALFMTSIDASIVATALPAIHKSLRSTINWTSWAITIYSLGMVVALPVAGKFSDQFGRRRVFIYGITVFTTSSLLCGLSTSVYVLIVFRALQALGGGALMPSAAGLVSDHFGSDRDKALGMFGTVAGSGLLIGPLVGGLLVNYLSWRWIFFVNLPIGVLLFILTMTFIPESHILSTRRTDVKGVVLLVLFVLSAMFGITDLGSAHSAADDPKFFVPELLAAFFLYLFVRHAKRTEAPFIPLRLLSAKGFAAVNIENVLWGVAGFGVASLIPLYAEQRYRLSSLDSGTLLTARGIGMISVGTLAALSLRRTGFRLPLFVGYSIVGVGILLMSISPRWGMSPYLWLSICGGISGIGNGMANPASRNACLQLAPDDVAAITGLRQMFIYIGIIFSVAITTAILNRSTDAGLAQAHIYWVIVAMMYFVMLPLISRVPEHKGTW